MNAFLTNLDITFRRDPTNYRPRINKLNSTKDREQKEAGTVSPPARRVSFYPRSGRTTAACPPALVCLAPGR